jgi:hypothetical protein
MNNQLRPALATLIREQVRKEVRAQLRRMAMSRTRDDFINRLVEVLNPALAHYYRIMLANLNGHTDQAAKWQEHQEDFLDQFASRMFDRTKAKGLDRKEAANKALEELMDHDAARRRRETSKFAATYKLKKIVPLPKDAHEGFMGNIRGLVDDMFAA